jgi:predicted Zn-dependent protease
MKVKILFLAGLLGLLGLQAESSAPLPNPLLKTMKAELTRSMAKLQLAGEKKPFFISYLLIDRNGFSTQAALGALMNSNQNHNRFLNVMVRVGDHKLDNMPAPEDLFNSDDEEEEHNQEYARVPIPLTDDPATMGRALWLLTDMRYKRALKQLTQKEGKRMQEVEEERPLDFSYEQPSNYTGAETRLVVDTLKWRNKVKEYSARFKQHSDILESGVSFSVQTKNDYFASSEGSQIQQGKVYYWLRISAATKAPDGMWVSSYRNFFGWNESDLPSDETVMQEIEALMAEVLALKAAPVMEAYAGPAIIQRQSAGVFVHEALGHRFESHRQGSKEYGETFKDKIGKKILPDFISIFDDPTLQIYHGTPVDGYYRYDEEGIPSRRVDVVQDGILKTFLSGRKPIKGLDKSNGHGRAMMQSVGYGDFPVPRQGNLILETTRPVSFAQLKEMLLAECRKKNKPYGLIFARSEGGSTATDRGIMEAFQSMPLVVFRVDALTGKEELVRGVKFGSTPLMVLDKIEATGDDPAAFNGFCGAESGSVPVALIAPSLLLSEVEIAKTSAGKTKPPILPPPF